MKAVALLRGINVGGKTRVPMPKLRELFESLGLTDVQSYVQSGNVVFSSKSTKLAAPVASLEEKIAETFRVQVNVLLRTATELGKIAADHPFLADESELSHLHVVFLRDAPTRAAAGKLDPDRSPPDRFVVKRREIFVHYPNGSGRSKLTLGYFERTLGTIGTARNWKTVLKLHDMLHR
jgi:uncharacterized protein (DUF1697 family)